MGFFKNLFSGKEPSDEERSQKREENDFDVLKYNGIQASQTGRLTHAIVYLTHALDIKEDEEAHVALVNTYIRDNNLEQAAEEASELCEIYPEKIGHPLTFAYLLFQLERYDEMESACQQALAIDSNSSTAYYLLAEKNYATSDYASAEANATKAIELNPESYDSYLLRARAYHQSGKDAEALADLNHLDSTGQSTDDVLLLRGEVLESTGATAEALSSYQQVVEENPFQQDAYAKIALLHIQMEDYESAEEVINDAIEQNGEYSKIIQVRCQLKTALGDTDGADADSKLASKLLAEEEVAEHKEANIEQEMQNKYDSINPF